MLNIGKKGVVEFAWIFAVIIGGLIIVLSVFFAGKLFETGSYQNAAETARTFDSMLNPAASTKQATVTLSKPVPFPQETEMLFQCDSKNDNQKLSVKTSKKSAPFVYTIKNKYIFGNNFSQEEIWIFSKSFYMPWRVDDLIYALSSKYCFINPPDAINAEINALSANLMYTAEDESECGEAIKVCFGSQECDINVDYIQNTVKEKKRGTSLGFFDDSTMYAAIFGPEIYNCNIERVLNRLKSQIDLFSNKALLLTSRGCEGISRIRPSLAAMKGAINNKDYIKIIEFSNSLKEDNPITCPLF